jgi:hypothetical protein
LSNFYIIGGINWRATNSLSASEVNEHLINLRKHRKRMSDNLSQNLNPSLVLVPYLLDF